MVYETIVSTVDRQGRHNAAPMGVWYHAGDSRNPVLRPYQSTHTYANLVASGGGVINFSTDGALYVYTALGDPPVEGQPAQVVSGIIIADVPGYWEVEVASVDSSMDRARVHCRILKEGLLSPFAGINRAACALLEVAVHASRLSLVSPPRMEQEMERAQYAVEKTGGAREREALQFLINHVREHR